VKLATSPDRFVFGSETVRYVSNITKYYVAYTLASERLPTERTD